MPARIPEPTENQLNKTLKVLDAVKSNSINIIIRRKELEDKKETYHAGRLEYIVALEGL